MRGLFVTAFAIHISLVLPSSARIGGQKPGIRNKETRTKRIETKNCHKTCKTPDMKVYIGHTINKGKFSANFLPEEKLAKHGVTSKSSSKQPAMLCFGAGRERIKTIPVHNKPATGPCGAEVTKQKVQLKRTISELKRNHTKTLARRLPASRYGQY